MAAMVVTFLIICLGDYRVGRLLLGTCEMEAALHLVFERGSGTVQSCLSSQTLKLTLRSAMPYICRLPRSIWFRAIKSGHSLVTLLMLLAESELHDTPKQKKKTEWRKSVVNLCRNVKNIALFRPTALVMTYKLQIQTPVNTALTFHQVLLWTTLWIYCRSASLFVFYTESSMFMS